MPHSFIALALVVITTGALSAETLDKYITNTVQKYQLPAMSAIAFRGNLVLEQGCAGVRCVGKSDSVTITDRFHVGSVTKSMTSSLAALLVDEKRLSWDDSIVKVLGKDFPNIHPSYRGVTLRQLCEHRGGMPAFSNDALWKELWQRSATYGAAENRRWYIGERLKNPPAQAVGTYVYSNDGYMTVGLMLETVTKTSWETMMRERLFLPLSMKQSGFGPAATPNNSMSQPWPHINRKPVQPGLNADNPAALGPAGTVHTSIGDLARYGQWHLNAGLKKSGPSLSPATFTLLHTSRYYVPRQGGYALGWQVVPRLWANGDALSHSGSNTMNYAVIWLAPARDLGIAVLCNEGQGQVRQATDDVVTWLFNKYTNTVSPPTIISQPKGLSIKAASGARFSVTASGTNLSYQWSKNGSAIKGATGASFNIISAKTADVGNYTVTVTNTAGNVVSSAAKLVITY
jgi:CubicO group peptidase (beta-lactamase class C family)